MIALVADDSRVARGMVSRMVSSLGFEVITAEHGEDALEKVEGLDRLDAVVTDWNMPGMDGLTLLKNVRSDDTLAGMPVLMVTAEAKREQIVVAAEAGVNGYVVKPFTAATLKEKIEKIFQRLDA